MYLRLKRAADAVLAVLLLILLSPLLGVISLLVALLVGRPVFFRQERTGLRGRRFMLTKFRSMTYAVDSSGRELPDAERLTRLGRFLRASSLDELPELLNVVRGDMSIVGPRPLLPQYDPLYSAHQARRLEVRPGITGWAQVHGRNSIGWEEKFDFDVWYVDHASALLDLRIILETVRVVLQREGISQSGEATASAFTGTPHVPEEAK